MRAQGRQRVWRSEAQTWRLARYVAKSSGFSFLTLDGAMLQAVALARAMEGRAAGVKACAPAARVRSAPGACR